MSLRNSSGMSDFRRSTISTFDPYMEIDYEKDTLDDRALLAKREVTIRSREEISTNYFAQALVVLRPPKVAQIH